MGNVLSNPLDQALAAAANGPFFPDWEFHALFGLSRSEVSALIGTAGDAPKSEQHRTVVGNAVNNLLGYPHEQESQWLHWLTCTPRELESAYNVWQASSHEA